MLTVRNSADNVTSRYQQVTVVLRIRLANVVSKQKNMTSVKVKCLSYYVSISLNWVI